MRWPGRKLATIFILYLSLTHVVVAPDAKNPDGSKKKLSPTLLFLRDTGIAIAFVAGLLLAMYAYTGLWPPLVVVESDSMMHSNENVSYVGVIDTGDLVLVKSIDHEGEIETYMDGYLSGHRTYGDYGDVIVYRVNGATTATPIIHRAMIYLEPTASGDAYRAPALRDLPKGEGKWATSNADDTWDHLTSVLWIYEVGYMSMTVTIDINGIITDFARDPLEAGFITKGDHNPNIDQVLPRRHSPVQADWVVGKARGEIPWFGLLKLWTTNSLGSPSPPNSITNLWISLTVIVLVPIVIDVALTHRLRRRIARKRAAAVIEYELEKTDESIQPVSSETPPEIEQNPESQEGNGPGDQT